MQRRGALARALAGVAASLLMLTVTAAPAALAADGGPGSALDPSATPLGDTPSVLIVAPDAEAGSSLKSVWPADGYELWTPPRQGWLEFTSPVSSASMTVTLERTDGTATEPVTRVTKGDAAKVYLEFSDMTAGDYQLSYRAKTVAGKEVSGTTQFSVDPLLTAIGGGNHRHAEDAVYRDGLGQWILRIVLVWSGALLLWASYRRRLGVRTLVEPVIARMAGVGFLAFGVAASVMSVLSVIALYPEEPLAGALASDATWVFAPLALGGAVQAVAGWRGRGSGIATYVALAMAAGSTAERASGWALPQTAMFMATLMLAATTLAALMQLALYLLHRSRRVARPLAARVMLLGAGTTTASMLMVPLQARSILVHGDFAADLRGRAIGATLLLGASGALWLLSLRQGKLPARLLAMPLLLAAMAGLSWLLWLAPPTAGL